MLQIVGLIRGYAFGSTLSRRGIVVCIISSFRFTGQPTFPLPDSNMSAISTKPVLVQVKEKIDKALLNDEVATADFVDICHSIISVFDNLGYTSHFFSEIKQWGV